MCMHDDCKELNDQFVKLGFEPGYDTQIMNERLAFIDEEFYELNNAVDLVDRTAALDALVDMVVVIMGTAHHMGWDFEKAWNKVHEANMKKTAVKGEAINDRDMSFDLKKPVGWIAPDLEDCV